MGDSETIVAPDIQPTTDVDAGGVGIGIPTSGVPAAPAGEAEPEPESTQVSPPAPAKTADTEVLRILRELRQSSPDSAAHVRAIQDAYYRAKAYGEVYPSLEDARISKATLDALGPTGLEDFETLRRGVERLDAGVANGESWVIEDMASDSPEGFKKLVPTVLDTLQRMDTQRFGEIIRPHLVRELESTGLRGVVARAMERGRANDLEGVMRELGDVAQWLTELQRAESTRPASVDPRAADMDKRETALREQQQGFVRSQVQTSVQTYLTDILTKELASIDGAKGLSAEARQDLMDGAMADMDKILAGDKAYQSALRALYQKGDVERIVGYIRTHADQLRGKSVRAVWQRRYGNAKPGQTVVARSQTTAKPAEQANPPSEERIMMLPSKPNASDIDWERDPGRLLYITGRAYLKSGPYAGRLVKWAKV